MRERMELTYFVDEKKSTGKEWESEPDFMLFEHKGIPCMIRRNHLGSLCGYVGVDFAVSEEVFESLEVHGGITYTEKVKDFVSALASEFQDYEYIIGFDTAHVFDLVPSLYMMNPALHNEGTYRNIEYVTNECENLAEQVIRLKNVFLKIIEND